MTRLKQLWVESRCGRVKTNSTGRAESSPNIIQSPDNSISMECSTHEVCLWYHYSRQHMSVYRFSFKQRCRDPGLKHFLLKARFWSGEIQESGSCHLLRFAIDLLPFVHGSLLTSSGWLELLRTGVRKRSRSRKEISARPSHSCSRTSLTVLDIMTFMCRMHFHSRLFFPVLLNHLPGANKERSLQAC